MKSPLKLLENITFFYLTLCLGASFAVPDAHSAEGIKVLKRIKEWTIYRHKDGNDQLCFISAQPKSSRPKNKVRGSVRFYVTSWMTENVSGEVSVKIGYTFDKNSQTEAKIDRRSFKMSTSKDRAYIDDPDQEAAFVNAMRRGSVMTIYGRSSRGTNTTDTYSLSGVTAALNAMKTLCK